MAKIKLVEASRIFVPDVDFTMDDGKTVNNRDLPGGEQVSGEIKIASIEEKSSFLGSYSVTGVKKKKATDIKSYTVLKYKECMEKMVGKVKGLEDYKVTSGATLYAQSVTYPLLGDVVREFFFKVNGIHDDDVGGEGDAGEMKEGE